MSDLEALCCRDSPQLRRVFDLLPDGWLPYESCRALYNLACCSSGPILEIGSFVGRSTAVLAYALQHSGSIAELITTDLHLETEEEWRQHYVPIHGPHTVMPDMQRSYMRGGGTWHHLSENLWVLGLLSRVTLLRGDFAAVVRPRAFALVFCDASHDTVESGRNIPRLKSYLASGSVLVCDDVADAENRRCIQEHLPFSCSFQTGDRDRLFVGVVA